MDDSESFPLPEDLPEPDDDGAADHLPGTSIPSISLPATDGTIVDLGAVTDPTVVYCYPKTGRPDQDVIPDGWEEIPGARGCTPESRGFAEHHDRLRKLGVADVFGLSLQSTAYQCEAKSRLGLPFELLSDDNLKLTDCLDLPVFEAEGEQFLKRLTLVLWDGRISHVFYPIFPPDEHAKEVADWFERHELE